MKIIYKHIPKTAGLSIKEILPDETLFLGHDFYSKGYKDLDYYANQYLQKFVITFVRNPYERAVSAFFYLNLGGNNPKDEKDRNKYIAKYNGDFEKFVLNEFKSSYSWDPPAITLSQIHFFPQSCWISYGFYNLFCNYIGKVEHLDEDIVKLSQFIPLKSTNVPKRNISKHDNYKKYYTKKTQNIIFNYYRSDFKLFGYNKEL